MSLPKISFFIPVRKNSTRVKNKSTKPFGDFEFGLIELKLSQVIKCKMFCEIVVSSDDPVVCSLISKKFPSVTFVRRDPGLCLDETTNEMLADHAEESTKGSHILLGHVTSPLVNEKDYDMAAITYLYNLQHGFDSLLSVTEHRNFLLDENGILQNKKNILQGDWPRTQDLKVLYEPNSALFISSRENYQARRSRIGKKPYMFIMGKWTSIDIDWPEDFNAAQVLYKSIEGPKT